MNGGKPTRWLVIQTEVPLVGRRWLAMRGSELGRRLSEGRWTGGANLFARRPKDAMFLVSFS